jgi:AcrR family transcriptional regulator
MAASGKGAASDTATRTALLDSAQQLMIDEGYAAATTRRVSQHAGVNNGLVTYYFGNLDGLFIALFQRGAERSLARLKQALQSPQPLWAVWTLSHDFSSNALTTEFTALANHRKAIRNEIATYSRTFRALEVETLSEAFKRYGVDPDRWQPAALIVTMSAVSRYLHIEDAFEVDAGHAETVAMIEREIEVLEGPPAAELGVRRLSPGNGTTAAKKKGRTHRIGSSPKTVVRKSSRGDSGS